MAAGLTGRRRLISTGRTLDVTPYGPYKGGAVWCRNGYGVVCKTIYMGSIPIHTSTRRDSGPLSS